ncbi:hypothetical protein ACFQ1S_47275, partial [Kibdelosporangium lantanae]
MVTLLPSGRAVLDVLHGVGAECAKQAVAVVVAEVRHRVVVGDLDRAVVATGRRDRPGGTLRRRGRGVVVRVVVAVHPRVDQAAGGVVAVVGAVVRVLA